MDTLTIERSILIGAPRERVWQAVTEPDQIAQWFIPASLGAQMKRGDDGKMLICMGPMEVGYAVYEQADPPRRVTTRGLPDRQLATTYTLEEQPDGTRVTVTMTGFDTLSEDARQDRLAVSGMAWEQALANLKAFVDGSELPFPEPPVAALFGYSRESQEKLAVARSIWIKAPRERVWQAITDPAQIGAWFSPGTEWRGTGLEVGGQLSVYNAETDSDMYIQVIDVVDPPRRLVTRSVAETPDVPHITEWILAEENGGTRLTITNSGYELEPADIRRPNMEQNAFGFGMMLDNLRAYIEGEDLPFPWGF